MSMDARLKTLPKTITNIKDMCWQAPALDSYFRMVIRHWEKQHLRHEHSDQQRLHTKTEEIACLHGGLVFDKIH